MEEVEEVRTNSARESSRHTVAAHLRHIKNPLKVFFDLKNNCFVFARFLFYVVECYHSLV